MTNFLASGLKKRESSNWIKGVRHVKYSKPPRQKIYPYMDYLPNLPFPMNNIKLIDGLSDKFNLNGLGDIISSPIMNHDNIQQVTISIQNELQFGTVSGRVILASEIEAEEERRRRSRRRMYGGW